MRSSMSLAAVPAYLLARRLVGQCARAPRGGARGGDPVARLHGHADDGERVLPAVPARALALVRALERPTLVRQLGVLARAGLAFETRAQAVALLPAILRARSARGARRGAACAACGASWLYGIVGGASRSRARRQGVRGRSPLAVLGAYSVAGEQHYTRRPSPAGSSTTWPSSTSTSASLPFAALLAARGIARAPDRAAPGVRRAPSCSSSWLAARGRRRSRRGPSSADRGAEHVLRRAAAADRARRRGSTRGVPRRRARDGRRRGRSPPRSPA